MKLYNTITRKFNMDDKMKTEVKDLLNQLAILLKDVPKPIIDEEYESDYGFAALNTTFKGNPNKFSTIKVIVEALVEDLQNDDKWYSDSEKLARAYYSSFCNG